MTGRSYGTAVHIAVAAVFGLCLLTTTGVTRAEYSAERVRELAKELGLEVGGQVRLRGELDARDFDSDTQTDEAVSSRVRFQLGVEPIENTRAFVQLQDVRVWGEESHTLADADADAFDLHQGYLVVDDFFGSGIQIQGGRQEVNFGEQRLVGAVNWTQNARSLDGILLRYDLDDVGWIRPFLFSIDEEDAVAGTVRQLDPNVDEGLTKDAWFTGFHSAWAPCEAATLEPHYYFFKDGERDEQRHTFGIYAHGSSPIDSDSELTLVYNATFDYQAGKLERDDIGAFLAVVHLGLKVRGVLISGGYEYLSGDDDPYDGDLENFRTLFATNHKFYGHMDYFLNNAADTQELGLQDIVAKLRVPVADDTGLGADFHWFLTAEEDDGACPTARLCGSENFGQEVDLWLTYKYNKFLGFQAGYSFFVPGGAMRQRFRDAAAGRPGSRHASVGHWAYLMADLKF